MKRSKTILALALSALLVLAAGCGGGNSAASSAATTDSNYGASGGAEPGEAFDNTAASTGASVAGSSVYQNSGAKLIRRAELTIQTETFDQAVAALNQLVSGCGGYFENASVYAGSYRNTNASRWGEYVVRIPAEQYDAFLSAAGDLGYVTNTIESSEDVGEQYYDTEARLQTQRIKQERLLTLLEQAATMEDIISLENALSETEYQIEQLSSTLNRYDSLINFSTFTIYLDEVVKVTQEVGESASLGQRMGAGFAASLENLGRGCQELLVWLSYNLLGLVVLAAVAGGAGFAGWKLVKRHRAKRAAKEKPEQ